MLLFFVVQFDISLGEQVEDGKLFFAELFGDVTLIFDVQLVGDKVEELLVQDIDAQAAGVILFYEALKLFLIVDAALIELDHGFQFVVDCAVQLFDFGIFVRHFNTYPHLT